MKIFEYFIKDYKLIIYSILSLIISLIMSFLLNIFNNAILIFTLFLMILFLLFIIRITDDIFDYDKDIENKKLILTKKQLINLDITFIVLFILINLYQYQLLGLISVILILYIILQQKFELLKIIFMFLSSTYYLYVNSNSDIFKNYFVWIYLILCLLLPILYYFYKRSKKI